MPNNLTSRAAIDTALKLGPIEDICNICGKVHVFKPLDDELRLAAGKQLSEAIMCQATRAATGLVYADDCACFGVTHMRNLLKVFGEFCGMFYKDFNMSLPETRMMFGIVSDIRTFNVVEWMAYMYCNAQHLLTAAGYEYLIPSWSLELNEKIKTVQDRIVRSLRQRVGGWGLEDLMHPWLVVAPKNVVNQYIASFRMRYWISDSTWRHVIMDGESFMVVLTNVLRQIYGTKRCITEAGVTLAVDIEKAMSDYIALKEGYALWRNAYNRKEA